MKFRGNQHSRKTNAQNVHRNKKRILKNRYIHKIEFRKFPQENFQAQMCTWSPREISSNVYSIIIYNSLKLETAWMSISRRMDKYITAQSYNGDYSTTKMNKLLLYKAWMELRNLHKCRQTKIKENMLYDYKYIKLKTQEKWNYSD